MKWLELLERWGLRFLKDYATLSERVTKLEADNDMQWQTIKGLTAEIAELKRT